MTTFTNNNQPDSVEALFVDLTPEEAQNIAGGWGGFWRGLKKKFPKPPIPETVPTTDA
ncbi:MAG: hypothetical protein F6K11_29025 [Leptolyngbya sp. SIO3F4]|nr:hypothetical protein [Leptolyngbya sp. SIO3F4]